MLKYIITIIILFSTVFAKAQSSTNNSSEFDLVSFKAIPQDDNSVLLAWTTAKEIGSVMFQVERSVDNVSFSPLAQIPAAGNSDIYKSYSFKDNWNPNGDIFYRLKMIGVNNFSEMSQSVSLNLSNSDSLSIFTKVFPQPATDKFTVEFKSNREVPLTFRIMDMMGKNLYETQIIPSVLTQSLDFDVSTWQRGTYFVQMFNWEHNSLHKVVVQ